MFNFGTFGAVELIQFNLALIFNVTDYIALLKLNDYCYI